MARAVVVVYSPEFYQENKERFSEKSRAWRDANKDRAKENRRRYYLENREATLQYSREYNLKKKFNLSLKDYNNLLEKQQGVCAICKKTCSKQLAVDHNHTTGKIRGLLCNNCNRGLGHLKDSIDNLKTAIQYLETTND